jgi:hypothetical protein
LNIQKKLTLVNIQILKNLGIMEDVHLVFSIFKVMLSSILTIII